MSTSVPFARIFLVVISVFVLSWLVLGLCELLAGENLSVQAVFLPSGGRLLVLRLAAGLLASATAALGMFLPPVFSPGGLAAWKSKNVRLKALYEASVDGFAFVTPTGYLRDWNEAFRKMLGYTDNELSGKNVFDFTPEVYHEMERNLIRGQAYVNGYTDLFSKKLVRKNGEVFPVELRVYVHKEGSSVEGLWAIIRDISERKQQQKQLDILAKFPDENPNPILRINTAGVIQYANKSAKPLLDFLGCSEGGGLPPKLLDHVNEYMESPDPMPFSLNTSNHNYQFTIVALDESEELYLYGMDVTSQRFKEQQLLLSDIVFNNSIEGIIYTGAEGIIHKVNHAFTVITGYTEDEVIGKNPGILKSGRHNEEFYRNMWESLSQEGQWAGEIWNRKKNGELFPEKLTIVAMKNITGNVSHYVAVFYDISQQKEKDEHIQHLAFHDPLTNLPNRRLFYDRMKVALASAKRDGSKLGVLFVDINEFKKINDTYGHQFGDLLLQKSGRILTGLFRTEDTVAYYGSDKFIVLINKFDDDYVPANMSERILMLFTDPVQLDKQDIYISVNIGISVFPENGETIDRLERHADVALNRAKQLGTRNYRFYNSSMSEHVKRRLELETAMWKSDYDSEFKLLYQPKYDLAEGRITGIEALARWFLNGTMVSPLDFIPIAEDTGIIIKLGEWILNKACSDIKTNIIPGFGKISLAVNLSAKQFYDKALVEKIDAILKTTGYPGDLLNLEITENILLHNIEEAIDTMSVLKNRDISISVDDFGTGYSSLSYLTRLPLQILKIDKSFIDHVPENKNDIAVTKSIILMSKSLGIDVVAEGVETRKQLSFLKENGCDEIQGYFISKPVDVEELKNVMAKYNT